MMVVGAAHALAQLAATVAFADAGVGSSRIMIYDAAVDAAGGAPVGALLAEVVLAKPCGSVGGGKLTLNPAAAGGALALRTGIPRAAQWLAASGALVAAGMVTDAAHSGDFTVAGGVTAPGDDSPTIYAGGVLLLGAVVLD